MYKNVLLAILATVLIQNKSIASGETSLTEETEKMDNLKTSSAQTVYDDSYYDALYQQIKAEVDTTQKNIDQTRSTLNSTTELLQKKKISLATMEKTIWAAKPNPKFQKQKTDEIGKLNNEIEAMSIALNSLSEELQTIVAHYQTIIPSEQLARLSALHASSIIQKDPIEAYWENIFDRLNEEQADRLSTNSLQKYSGNIPLRITITKEGQIQATVTGFNLLLGQGGINNINGISFSAKSNAAKTLLIFSLFDTQTAIKLVPGKLLTINLHSPYPITRADIQEAAIPDTSIEELTEER